MSSNKDYSNISPEELLNEIEALKSEISSFKKYGLVWDKEKNQENVVNLCKEYIPILKRQSAYDIDVKSNNHNLLIEGDNFHVLTALLYTHTNKIDVIYIDPPYNTGNRDFMYNDNFIDKEDGYKHSKWLNMMEKRLNLAKVLLNDNGMIFISIDDNEMAQLKLLCDKIFGENNFESFIWKKKGGAGNTERIIGCLTEYIFCYFKKKKPGIFNYRKLERDYKYKDEIGPYNLEGIEKTNSGVYERPTMLFEIIDPKTSIAFKPSNGMRWTIGLKGVEDSIEKGKLFFDYKKNKVYYIKRPEDYEASENVFYNLFTDCGSLSVAKNEIEDLIGNREAFDTPKPVKLIKSILEIASKQNSTILDFFAGSGTTGQAVLELNKEDGGERRFILCTNNENNIATDITYPRLKTVITGIRPDGTKYSDGIPANLHYFKTDFIKDNSNRDQAKYNLVEKCNDLLCILENIFDLVESNNTYSHYSNDETSMFIYNDLYSKASFEIMKYHIAQINHKVIVYMFSTDNSVDESLFSDLDNVEIKPIPNKIYEIYKEIVEDIKRG